ncbi:MAG: hypothetical protein Q9163_005048 [Psora crenata]
MALAATVKKIQEHLRDTLHTPSTQLDARVLEHLDTQASDSLDGPTRHSLLNQLSQILPTLQQDPTPVTDLVERLISPSGFTFSDVLSIQPSVDFHAGLTSPLPPVNLVTLRLLGKAKKSIADIGIVAGQQEIVGALVRLWLYTQETVVGQRACALLSGLLLGGLAALDSSTHVDPLREENLMWRRVFRDKNIYESIFSTCSLSSLGEKNQLSLRQKTIAQGRLLEFLMLMRADPVRTSQIPEVERKYGVNDGGLLEFATVHMLDLKDDHLVLCTLICFCADFIRTEKSGPSSFSSGLEFLKKHGLHKSCLSYYLTPSPDHPAWVQTSAAEYVRVYCSCYREDFLNDPLLPNEIINIITDRLSNVSRGAWLSGRVPVNDLEVLSHLPQTMLLVHGSKSVLTMLPPNSSDACVPTALSAVFGCSADCMPEDQAAARALYFVYMDEYPDFWDIIIKIAGTVAILDAALAANRLMGSIIRACWQRLPTAPNNTARYNLPTEEWLSTRYNHGAPLPQTGIEAIMATGTVMTLLPYLLKPGQTFTSVVGGGNGDVKSAAWKVAVAKHEMRILFLEKIKQLPSSPDMQAMIVTLERCFAQGPMGGSSRLGGSIATMEQ